MAAPSEPTFRLNILYTARRSIVACVIPRVQAKRCDDDVDLQCFACELCRNTLTDSYLTPNKIMCCGVLGVFTLDGDLRSIAAQQNVQLKGN